MPLRKPPRKVDLSNKNDGNQKDSSARTQTSNDTGGVLENRYTPEVPIDL